MSLLGRRAAEMRHGTGPGHVTRRPPCRCMSGGLLCMLQLPYASHRSACEDASPSGAIGTPGPDKVPFTGLSAQADLSAERNTATASCDGPRLSIDNTSKTCTERRATGLSLAVDLRGVAAQRVVLSETVWMTEGMLFMLIAQTDGECSAILAQSASGAPMPSIRSSAVGLAMIS
jgi:hypothetical protein